MKSLTEYVHDLPPELFNRIYDLTFTAHSQTVYINTDYKSPSCARVNQSTREFFVQSYYRQGRIFWVDLPLDNNHKNAVKKWLTSHSRRELHLMRRAEFRLASAVIDASSMTLCEVLIFMGRFFASLPPISLRSLKLAYIAFKFGIYFDRSEDTVWLSWDDLNRAGECVPMYRAAKELKCLVES